MIPIFLYVALCLDVKCESQQFYQFKAHSEVTQRMDCQETQRDFERVMRQKSTKRFKTTCKTAAQFQRTGFDDEKETLPRAIRKTAL